MSLVIKSASFASSIILFSTLNFASDCPTEPSDGEKLMAEATTATEKPAQQVIEEMSSPMMGPFLESHIMEIDRDDQGKPTIAGLKQYGELALASGSVIPRLFHLSRKVGYSVSFSSPLPKDYASESVLIFKIANSWMELGHGLETNESGMMERPDGTKFQIGTTPRFEQLDLTPGVDKEAPLVQKINDRELGIQFPAYTTEGIYAIYYLNATNGQNTDREVQNNIVMNFVELK